MQLSKKSQEPELTMDQWCQREKDRILSYVSETDIIQAFWPAGRELKFNRAIISPFRNEAQESFIIGTKYGPVTYKDMGAYEYRGDVWKFVQQIEGLQKFSQVIKRIENRFNISKGIEEVKKVITWDKPLLEIKPPPHIQVSVRKFNKAELAYWNLYHQGVDDLQREEIYAPKEIYRNRRKLQLAEMTFCYWCPDIQKWKLYRPLASKRTKSTPVWQWKWDNSIGRLDYIEGVDQMIGPVGICTKSRKDKMMIRKATGIEAICCIQAEDPAAVSDEMLYQIWTNVGYKVCAMDNDKKGKEMSWWLSSRGYHHVNVPDNMLEEGISDFADMGRYYGIKAVTDHMKNKWVI